MKKNQNNNKDTQNFSDLTEKIITNSITDREKIKNLKLPPQNIDAEIALLGSILIKSGAIYEILEFITPESFYAKKHQLIFKNMAELATKSEPIDLLTISASLKDKNELETIGGDDYLVELSTSVATASNIEHYGKIVADKYIKRRLIEASEKISEIAYDQEQDIESSIDMAESTLSEISSSISSAEFIPINSTVKEAWERFERLRDNKGELRGIPTGFSSLNHKLSGFQNGDLIILAARPSVGKTTLSLDFARKIAVEEKLSVAYFSLEMSKDQITDKLLGAESGVDAWKLRTGNLSDSEDFSALRDAADRLSSAKLFIDDNSYNNVLRMKSAARKLKRKNGLDLIIVDYLQLMAPVKTGKHSSPVQEVTEISRGLKQLAKELEVPVIALSQLSRNVEHRGENSLPRLADLRDSGSIEQDADVVIFIHRDKSEDNDKARENITQLIIEKHRNGSTGTIELWFNDNTVSFSDVDNNYTGDGASSSQPSTDDFDGF